MKTIQYIVFFGIVFTIYGLINVYVYCRGISIIPNTVHARNIFFFTFLFFSFSFVIGRFLERIWLSPVSFAFTWIGSFWLAAMFYFFLLAVLSDIVRLFNHFFHFFPDFITSNPDAFRRYTFLIAVSVVVITLIAGHLNAVIPRVKRIPLTINKAVNIDSPFRVVVVSDIHLGTIIGPRREKRLVKKINSLEPDLVLFAGDVVDEDLGPVLHQNVGKELENIKSSNGIYSITGNHEYIGGVEEAVAFLTRHGITVLRDSVTSIMNAIYVVGREDHDQRRFGGSGKKPLHELLQDVERTKPVIVMDHQPTTLDESVQNKVDLHLSGHTHHGQIWPLNLLTRKIYQLSWGYEKRGTTHIYVSSGFGTWGPPVRIGSHPEIVELILNFNSSDDSHSSDE